MESPKNRDKTLKEKVKKKAGNKSGNWRKVWHRGYVNNLLNNHWASEKVSNVSVTGGIDLPSV